MSTEETNATDRGSECNDLLGPLPEPDVLHHELGTPLGYSPAVVRRLLAAAVAAERERTRQALSNRLAWTVMSKYASKAECEAARAALRNAMLDVWGA